MNMTTKMNRLDGTGTSSSVYFIRTGMDDQNRYGNTKTEGMDSMDEWMNNGTN